MITKIFEDSDILVLNKPSGVVVNNSQTAKSSTVQDFILKNYDLSAYSDEEFISRSGIVHRLDKDTSGLLLVTKYPESFYKIKEQFKNKTVKKEYIAVVLGEITDKNFEINAPIKRDQNYRTRMSINNTGRDAVTVFETIKSKKIKDIYITKLLAKPLTGRMHQIRVHLVAINHPVMCDPIYMTRQQYMSSKQLFGRLLLHAYKLSFVHPTTDEQVTFEAAIPQVFNF